MKVYLFALLACLHIFCFQLTAHPLKMSVTEIVYKDKKFTLKCKLFTDDVEMTLKEFCKTGKIDLINSGLDHLAAKCLTEHVRQNFFMELNGQKLSLRLLKMYLSNTKEVVYIEMESIPIKIAPLTKLRVHNTLLFSNNPEQKNIVNCTIRNQLKIILIENAKSETTKEIII